MPAVDDSPPPSTAAPPRPSPSQRPAARGISVRWTDPRQRYRRFARLAVPAVIAVALGALAGVGVAAAIHVPRVEAIANFDPARITQLLDESGKPFASYARQRRIVLQPDEIPPVMRDALIAVEDRNFYKHGGLDALGVLRALITNLRTGRRGEGASTLTMQLARQLFFLNPAKKWQRKIEEAFLAVELEKSFTKDQLLALYLNVIFLGHNQYGVEAASRYYFGKNAAQLTVSEAATLAGIYQRPSKLSPYNAPEAVVERRNHVLRRMLDERFLTREQFEVESNKPLGVVLHDPKVELGSYFAEEVRRYVETTYGSATLLEKGLLIATTMDEAIEQSAETALRNGLLRLDHNRGWRGPHQKLTEENLETIELESWSAARAVADGWFEGIVLESAPTFARVRRGDEVHTLTPAGIAWTKKNSVSLTLTRGDVAWFRIAPLKNRDGEEEGEPILHLEQEPRLQGAAIVLESATGAVRAMAGGWDFSRNQFNRATQAKRQVGSAFKMFVYGAALENGFSPNDTVFDAPVYFRGADGRLSYSPRNYYPTYYGIVTLSRALEQSYNVSAVKLMDMVGIDRTIDFARRLGVRSELPPYPSLALGSADLSPMEMAAAYATIANGGRYNEPYLIESIRFPDGQILESHRGKSRQGTSADVAYVLSHMLEGVVDRGTARALANLDLDIAGKTGTTNDYSNAWFIGFTPRHTVLVWVGYDQPRSMGRGMAGDKVAVPIWRELAVHALKEGWMVEKDRFRPPGGVEFALVDRASGSRVENGAEGAVRVALLAGKSAKGGTVTGDLATVLALPWHQQRAFYQGPEAGTPAEDVPATDEGPAPEGASEAPSEASPPPP